MDVPFFPSPSPSLPVLRKIKILHFLVRFSSNFNRNIFICFPLIDKITIWKERKEKFESDNVVDLVSMGHSLWCETPCHISMHCFSFPSHNDLPWNLRVLLRHKLSHFNLSADLSSLPPFGQSRYCHTDLPRLRRGQVKAQASPSSPREDRETNILSLKK